MSAWAAGHNVRIVQGGAQVGIGKIMSIADRDMTVLINNRKQERVVFRIMCDRAALSGGDRALMARPL